MSSEQTPGFYGRLAAFAMDRPGMAGLLLLLLTAISGFFMTRIRLDPDLVQLLPRGEPTTLALKAIQQEEGSINVLTVAVKGREPEVLDAFMVDLQARFDAMPDVQFTLYKVDPDLAWRLGVLNVPKEDLTRLRDRLRGALAMGPAIQNPFVAAQWLDLGAQTERLKARGEANPLATPQGVARLIIRPKGAATDMSFARPFMERVDKLLDEVDAPSKGLEIVWVGGAYHHNVEDLKGIAQDLQQTNTASLVLVFLLVMVAYRRFRAVILIFAPILLGNLWALGFAGATVRTLTSFSSFFSAVLVGLGMEFSIHLYSRYREELGHTREIRSAVIRAWDLVGPPSLTSALASAGGFLALWAARFQGFQQLGTLLAGGNLLCLLAVLVCLPMLIKWLEKAPEPRPAHTQPRHRHRRPRGLADYRLAPLILMILTLITIASGFMLPRVPFQFDVSELRREGLAFHDLDAEQRKLAEDSYAPVIASYPDDASLKADYIRLTDLVARGALPEVSRVLSIYSILPVDMEDRLVVLHEIADLSKDPDVIYLPPQVQQNLARIAAEGAAPLTREELPASLRSLLGAGGDHHWLALMPAGNMWDLRDTAKLYDALHEVLPDRPLASQYLALAVLYRLVEYDGPRVAIVALLIVFLTTALDLRNLRWAGGAIGALIAGMCWAGAAMALFQVKLSMINFVGIPILMGIAVDAIIHLLHRLSEEGPGRIRKALLTTGWAVALGALMNAFSFGSLVFASTEGVRALGLLVVLGLALVTTAAFVLVPLGWMTTWKIKGVPHHAGDDEIKPGGSS